ncbi:MAG: YdcF family protein [Synechococcales cyanobacterium T60_A2020_003]|nr:YdcF family protein [Synechococcales cyanobacterium T60_A2020_003]
MSLFISKLLPLFVYPLGLGCVLIVVALVTMWKKPRWAAISLILALLVLGLGGNGWVTTQWVRSLEQQYRPLAEIPEAEAIVVLGGATHPWIPPRPWVEVMESGDRPLYAARLYRQKKAPLVILSGGRVDWYGKQRPESSDMAELMETMGVPATAIVEEPDSLNTYENAVNVKKILDQRSIKHILLVTSAMHMPRSLKIFQKQGIEAIPAPTDFLIPDPVDDAREISFEARLLDSLPSSKYLEQTTQAIKEHIGYVIYALRGWL